MDVLQYNIVKFEKRNITYLILFYKGKKLITLTLENNNDDYKTKSTANLMAICSGKTCAEIHILKLIKRVLPVKKVHNKSKNVK